MSCVCVLGRAVLGVLGMLGRAVLCVCVLGRPCCVCVFWEGRVVVCVG